MTRQEFYKTKAWEDMTTYIWLKQNCLCARCKRAVYKSGISQWIPKDKRLKGIVHHKKYLTEENYLDDSIALNEDNLEGICIDCHNKEHFKRNALKDDVMFDEFGNLVERR